MALLININRAAVSGSILKSVAQSHSSPQKNIDRGKSRKPITAIIVIKPIRGLALYRPDSSKVVREPKQRSTRLTAKNIPAVASECPQIYKTVPMVRKFVSTRINSTSKLTCRTEPYAIIAFKST